MKYPITTIIVLSLFFTGCSDNDDNTEAGSTDAAAPASVELTSEVDSVSYGIGVNIANNLLKDGLDSLNTSTMKLALDDVMSNQELRINEEEISSVIQSYFTDVQKKKAENNLAKSQAFLRKNASKEGVQVTESGLQYKVIKMGDGPKPNADDKVKVHYHGTLINGDVFDSSVDRGQPVEFPLDGVIRGWTEGLQLMPVGSKFKFFIPSDLAYGPQGNRNISANSALIFEVELIDIIENE